MGDDQSCRPKTRKIPRANPGTQKQARSSIANYLESISTHVRRQHQEVSSVCIEMGETGRCVQITSKHTETVNSNGRLPVPRFQLFPSNNLHRYHHPTSPDQHYSTNLQLSNAGSPPQSANPSSGTKRKADSISHAGSPSANVEDAARNAAEEDKRRRNTAASARFRVKKKQREQALERSAKDMSDKVAALEGRINQLETENKWLKNLITERNESKEDIAGLWKKYNAENAERKGSERKDGVGTSA